MKIERGIPAPSGPAPGKKQYPFDLMKVGDSIFVEPTCDDHTKAIRARDAAHKYGNRQGKEFRTKAENGGIRIWRIK